MLSSKHTSCRPCLWSHYVHVNVAECLSSFWDVFRHTSQWELLQGDTLSKPSAWCSRPSSSLGPTGWRESRGKTLRHSLGIQRCRYSSAKCLFMFVCPLLCCSAHRNIDSSALRGYRRRRLRQDVLHINTPSDAFLPSCTCSRKHHHNTL